MIYNFYTDGSCLGNPGPAGAAWVLEGEVDRYYAFPLEGEATNNKAELSAILDCIYYAISLNMKLVEIEPLELPTKINIYTDSLYSIKTITKQWKAKENLNLLEYIWAAVGMIPNCEFEFHYIKAHNGNFHNELVDNLAKQAAKYQKTISNLKNGD